MRPERLAEEGPVRCGGFRVAFDGDDAVVRLLPGALSLPDGAASAVLQGLREAPRLLANALSLRAPRRPYDRVEVLLTPGELTQGEALSVGIGSIRLLLGEGSRREDAARIARHEALHLLLAASLRGGERWNDPELAFADWIVRGIEGAADPEVPRFQAPLPQLLDPVPVSRVEVQQRLAAVTHAPAVARRYFGERLFAGLQRIESEAASGTPPHEAPALRALIEQRQLWLVEAALGTHYLEAASRLPLDETQALRAVVLDDWLLDYEQYARAVANAPSGAGNLWRLSDAGWSRDPLTRLSVAAQALQRDDHCFFAGDRYSHASEPVVWKNRGRVRLPLLPAQPRARAAPIHGFRAVLRALESADSALALSLVEDAAHGVAQHFEARALWPRILSRLLLANLPAPGTDGAALPCVQLVDGAVDSRAAYAQWRDAASALSALLGERSAWVPLVLPPQHLTALAEAPRPPASILLVHPTVLSARTLLATRQLAVEKPVRGALFLDPLGKGLAYEQLPDFEPPLDPRYREEAWLPPATLAAGALASLDDLPALIDGATQGGRLTTPLSHLLSMMAMGLEECHYLRASAAAPGWSSEPAGPGEPGERALPSAGPAAVPAGARG